MRGMHGIRGASASATACHTSNWDAAGDSRGSGIHRCVLMVGGREETLAFRLSTYCMTFPICLSAELVSNEPIGVAVHLPFLPHGR